MVAPALFYREASGAYIAGERLRLFNTDVRFQHHVRKIVGNTARDLPLEAPVEGESDLVDEPPGDAQGPHTMRNHRSRLDLAARRADDHPIAVLDVALGSQLGADFSEERGLQRVEPGHPARHRTADVMLRQAVSGDDDRIVLIPNGCETIELPILEVDRGRIALLLVERVMYGRLRWLVVRWQRPILHPLWREEPAPAIRLHNEGIAARNSVHARRVGWRRIVGSLVQREIGNVVARPLFLFRVPPDVLLALRPGAALRIRRCTVVEDAPVGGPGEAPLQERIAVGVGDTRGRAVVARLRVDTAVDPGPTGGTAVGFERREARHMLRFAQRAGSLLIPVCLIDIVAINLFEHQQGVGFIEDA